MFRIRRIYDDISPSDKQAIGQIQKILIEQFPLLNTDEIEKLPFLMRNPQKYGFQPILIAAEQTAGQVAAFSLLLYEPQLDFCFLDYLSSAPKRMGRGLGAVLYERVREQCLALGAKGLFFECLPDDAVLSPQPQVCKINQQRLKFYERYGARPIANTKYETPLKENDDNPPYLVFDDLGMGTILRRDYVRAIMRAILEKKYGHICPKSYIEMVVESVSNDPVRLREYRYIKKDVQVQAAVKPAISDDRKIALIVNEKHPIHHVHDRGYVESPVRIEKIEKELAASNIFVKEKARLFSEKYIRKIHDAKYVDYFKQVCEKLEPDKSVYPYVFPVRNLAKPPKELLVRAGYFCIDTFTPLNRNAYIAAKGAVDCALTCAENLLRGRRMCYALVRPPGHHAERSVFGGFCYFNSNAVAADFLSGYGKVAILDIDYHHGNGQQQIFYKRADILTVSIHGHPSFAYPYFGGFADERGDEAGTGFNINYPLAETITAEMYMKQLEKACRDVMNYKPEFLVIALGLDTAYGDPTGSWPLRVKDFAQVGQRVGQINLPTMVVQEGGYNTRVLGINARSFFEGLWQTKNKGFY
ncbi:MAG: histone deacetylase family protein [Phycisphaerae bacterium]|nr:histone deacetylase family protein [Phycisphaerae bacterium]